jgi:hypothetical protein
MAFYVGGYPRETLKEAGYREVKCLGDGEHLLEDVETGKQEIWANDLHHAGYALVYRNTELEYMRDALPL